MRKKLEDYRKKRIANPEKIKGGGQSPGDGGIEKDKLRRPTRG